MPAYEVLALVALAAIGGFAFYVSRQPLPAKPLGQDDSEGSDQPTLARDPKDRDGGITGQ